MKRVGLYGFYQHHNFGDDLMAAIICDHLQQLGHEVVLYGTPELASDLNVENVADVKTLVSETDACVVGGGAWLSGFEKGRHITGRKSSEDCHTLALSCQKAEKPFVFLSIGGNDTGKWRGIRTGVAAALASPMCLGATCRLKTDLDFLDQFQLETASFPDIVLCLHRSRLVHEGGTPKPSAVLINLSKREIDRGLVKALHALKWHFGDRILFAHNSPGEEEQFKSVYNLPFQHHSSQSFRDTLQLVQQCRGVYTYRLHLGVSALALGRPFFGFNPKRKARLFFQDYDWGNYVHETRWRQLPAVLSQIKRLYEVENFDEFLPADLNRYIKASYGHLEWLEKKCQQVL